MTHARTWSDLVIEQTDDEKLTHIAGSPANPRALNGEEDNDEEEDDDYDEDEDDDDGDESDDESEDEEDQSA